MPYDPYDPLNTHYNPTQTLEPFPPTGTEQTFVEPAFQRFMPLPDVAVLKQDYMFGLPLRAALTGQVIADATLQRFITQAISELEHELQIYISPITVNRERHNYSWTDFYNSYAFIKTNLRPILEVHKLEISVPSAGGETFVQWPSDWLKVYNAEGTLQLTPLAGSGSIVLLSSSSGTVFPARFFTMNNYPQFFAVSYRVGFEVDRTPAIISELVAVTAAIKALSMLGPVIFPYQSYSQNLDGLGQSVSTAGPAFLNTRITSLQDQRQQLLEAVKSFYEIRLHMAVLG